MFDLEAHFGFDKGNRKKDSRLPDKDASPHLHPDPVLPTSKDTLVLKPTKDNYNNDLSNQPKQADVSSPKEGAKIEIDKVRIEDLVEKAFSILQKRNAALREFSHSAGKEDLQLRKELGEVIDACKQHGIDVQIIYKKAEDRFREILEEALKNHPVNSDSVILHWPINPEWQLAVRPKETVQISFSKKEDSQPEQPLKPGEYQALEIAAQIYTQFNKLFEGEFTIVTEGEEKEPEYAQLMQELTTHCQKYGLDIDDIKRQTETDYKTITDKMYEFSPKWPSM